MPSAAISALLQGNKLEAIKIVRQERNIGLKEAKAAVENYVRSRPAAQSSLTGEQPQTKWSTTAWLVVVIGLALLAYHFLLKR